MSNILWRSCFIGATLSVIASFITATNHPEASRHWNLFTYCLTAAGLCTRLVQVIDDVKIDSHLSKEDRFYRSHRR